MEDDFIKEYQRITTRVPVIVGGKAILSAENLQTLCYGFYIFGKRVQLEAQIEKLNTEINKKLGI